MKHRVRWLALLAALALGAAPVPASGQGVPDVPREQTLVHVLQNVQQIANADNFNPYLAGSAHAYTDSMRTWVEPLIMPDLETGVDLNWQATGYENSADGMSTTLHLRPEVAWADGVPFTANDVKFTIDMLLANPDLPVASDFVAAVESVEVVDDQTVVLHYLEPNPRFFRQYVVHPNYANFFVVVPEHVWKDQDPHTFTNFDLEKGWPLGTGAWRLVSADADQLLYDLDEDWWGYSAAPPMADRSEVKRQVFIAGAPNDDAVANLLVTNAIDYGFNIPRGAFEAIQAQNPSITTWNESGPVWGGGDGCLLDLKFNTTKPPFDDVNLRLAVNYAIDRQELADLAYEGSTTPAVIPLSTWVAPRYVPGQIQAVADGYDRGTASQAKVDEHMAASGYAKDADGFYAKDGVRLTWEAKTYGQWEAILPAMVAQLRDAGFDVTGTIVPRTSPTWHDELLAGDFTTYNFVYCASLEEPYTSLRNYHSRWLPTEPGGKALNDQGGITGWSSPEFDAFIDTMEGLAPDPTQGSEYMNAATGAIDLLLRDVPTIMLLDELQILPWNETYWIGWPDAENPYVNAAGYNFWGVIAHRLKPAQ